MKQILKYWKQLLGVVIVLAVSFIGMGSIMAASVGISIMSADTPDNQVNLTSWEVGHMEYFAASVTGVDDLNPDEIQWTSDDQDIVSVSNTTGQYVYLKATGAGTTKITASYTFDNNGVEVTKSDVLTITVKLGVTNDLSNGFIQLASIGSKAVISTNYKSDEDLLWSSDDSDVVSVASNGDGTGTVTAVSGGSATITIRTPDNNQYCTFDVLVNIRFTEAMKLETMQINPGTYTDVVTGTTNASANKDVTITSANEDYLVVDSDGYAYGETAGYVLLYAYPKYDYSKTAFADLTPAELAARFGDSVNVMVKFCITNGDLYTAVGDTVQLKTNASEDDLKGVNWTSDNTNIVAVDADGVLTARASGTANVTATLDSKTLIDGQRMHSSAIKVTVIDSFAVSETEHMMNVGESFDLYAIVTDQKANVTWTSSDESIATVTLSDTDKYTVSVTGVKKGNAVIKAIQEVNGVKKYAECQVSINEPVQNITLVPTELEIDKGEQYPLKLIFEPEKADNTQVIWVSSDESVATVSDAGVISAVDGGDCTISVVTLDGVKVASCKLHVRVPVTAITLSETRVRCSLSLGTYQLSYNILPEGNGVNKNVVWESSNPSVLTVDKNGFVTFVAPGNATVLCQTEDTGTDGINLVATCEFVIEQPVTSVSLDYTDVTLKIGETLRLTSTVLPKDATNKELTWVSSNTSVVTVEDGLLTAVAGGDAAVLVQSVDSGVTALCNVKVYQPVTSVTISSEVMEVRRGTDFWLYATANPSNADNPAISWSSSNSNVATVDSTGKVTTLDAGETTITATSIDTGVFATCKLTVLEPVTGISLNIESTAIYKGSKFVLIPTVTPIDADNKSVTYTSSDPDIASVDANGIVTGLKGGKCIILATTVERGLVASCEVEVYEFVTAVKIQGATGNINYGETRMLTADVTPDSATNTGVNWSSSNNGVIQVTDRGVVTAVGYGTAVITAMAADGSGVYDQVTYTCIKPVSSIQVSPSYVTMLEGKTVNVTATVSPSDATYTNIAWSSSDEAIAYVDYNGGITGVKAGTCYVYATSTDGNNVTAIVKVTVKPVIAATGVRISSGTLTLLPGQTSSLKYKLKPSNSTDTIEWITSDPAVATVSSSGVVTARGQGSCEIYCISSSGAEGVCELNVVALNATHITLEQYDSYTLDVFGASGRIKWYTNNNRIATVSSNGTVIGRKPGTTTITANIDGKLLYCTVTVTKLKKY